MNKSLWITIPLSEGSLYLWRLLGSCKHVSMLGANNHSIFFRVIDTCPFFKLGSPIHK